MEWKHSTPFQFSAHPYTRCIIYRDSMQTKQSPLQYPWPTAATPPPVFKTGQRPTFVREHHSSSRFQNWTAPHFRERASLLLSHGSILCGFRFCERALLPLLTVAFQFCDPTFQMNDKRR
ncbi:hypothetical protein AVEN_97059-1 [Araneus ventricosus]|uniref:Uncharacterized protein n=1 Tax=Araneus ventricosus TaxID=182803 RepID=A0A4Y2JJ96_ARAVE|nr:hypothetical protein AVEN_97059-1 [Araneus ventricosus]